MVASGYAPYRAVFFPHLLLPASSCSRRSGGGGLAGRSQQQWLLAFWRPPAADLAVVNELARLISKTDLILTGA